MTNEIHKNSALCEVFQGTEYFPENNFVKETTVTMEVVFSILGLLVEFLLSIHEALGLTLITAAARHNGAHQ